MASELIGKYRVLDEIASGGQGAVYRAFDPSTGMIVAVKVLHAQYASNKPFVERFRREATLIQAIDHQNVVKIFDVGESGGRNFIVLEFIPASLSDLIEATGALPADRAVALAIGISEGIGQAHAQGIIHRDIKPQNVLLTPQGIPKVTDFGIARDESLDTMTVTGVMMGTPYYMSPEQAEGQRADSRSDVYSLGCLLYRMLAGEVPFSGDTPLAILRNHVDSTPTPLRKISGAVPRSVIRCVEKAMEKDPSKRYADATVFATDLRKAMPGLIVQTPPPELVTPAPAEPTSPKPKPTPPKPVTPVSQPPAATPVPVGTGSSQPSGPSAISRAASALVSGVTGLISGVFSSLRATLTTVGVIVIVGVVGYFALNSNDPAPSDSTKTWDEATGSGAFTGDTENTSANDSAGFAPLISANVATDNGGADGESGEPELSLTEALVATAAAKSDATQPPTPTPTSMPIPVPVLESGWITVDDMTWEHWRLTATTLPDGRVLVIGSGNDAEIYDPTTRSFSPAENTLCEYATTPSVLLADGRVLLTGGDSNNRCAEIFDPANGQFFRVGDTLAPHWGHTATLLQDGRVLIAGGWESSNSTGFTTDATEIYDPTTGRFTGASTLAIDRGAHTAQLLPGGEVLIVGGIKQIIPYTDTNDGDITCLNTAEIFNPITGTSRVVDVMPAEGCEPESAVLPGSEILISPGNEQLVIFNPATETFRRAGNLGIPRGRHTLASLNDGRVVLIGGWRPSDEINFARDEVELYDPYQDTITQIESLNQERFDHASVVLNDGSVLVLGGQYYEFSSFASTGSFPLSSAEIFNPTASLESAGLIHLWSGDGDATDSVGNNNGTAFGGVTYSTGVRGSAFRFDGTGHVELGDISPITEEGTIELWIYADEIRGFRIPFSTYFDNGAQNIRMELIGPSSMYLVAGNPGGYIQHPFFTTRIQPKSWHHVALSWTNGGANLRGYFNGHQAFDESNPHSPPSFGPAAIGLGENRDENRHWKGLIDEVAIYNRTLSANEIRRIFQYGNANLTGLPITSPTPTSKPETGDAAVGEKLYVSNSCSACHSTGTNTIVGPGHAGVYERAGSRTSLSADAYIEQSIRDPGGYLVDGFPAIMPTFNHLSDTDVKHLIAFLKTLSASASPAATTAPAVPTATTRPAATAAPAAAAPTARPAATVAPAATATTAPIFATNTPAPSTGGTGPSGSVVRAFRTLESVYGIGYVGPYRNSATNQLGGVEEPLFNFQNGNPMTPFLVDSWDIDAAGTRVRMSLKKSVKWQSPRGFENIDFGELNAPELVEWLNRSNATTNPESTYGDAGDFAALFLEARAIDTHTVEIGLVAPVYFCLPVSQFGCFSAARGPHKVTSADTFGVEWARAHHIGTGPYVQGDCTPGDRCTVHAVNTHWRQIGNVAQITGIQVPETTVQIAMLKNGSIDMVELDYKLLPDIVSDGFNFLETMPGGFVGQSILFPGNLWEHSHARTAEPLDPWDAPPYAQDYQWIGNPWGHQGATCSNGDVSGHERCGNAPYTDTDNPAGMDDMEQARLVRLALSTAIDRTAINDVLLNGIGTPIYSEYMGPEYPGWDASRTTGCFNWLGNPTACTGTIQSVPWKIADANLTAAGNLLNLAGYPLVNGSRQGFGGLTLQAYSAEAGPVGLEVADTIMSDWARLGIQISGLVEDYGGVISPRMRQRIQILPVLKNGDVHSNVYPLDWPLPIVDTSSSRPGWGVGFESQAGAKWLFEILGERDAGVRTEKHLNWVDYSMFWLQYAGVFQVPKGIVTNDRIKSWNGYQEHYSNVSSNPEFIVLN